MKSFKVLLFKPQKFENESQRELSAFNKKKKFPKHMKLRKELELE